MFFFSYHYQDEDDDCFQYLVRVIKLKGCGRFSWNVLFLDILSA